MGQEGEAAQCIEKSIVDYESHDKMDELGLDSGNSVIRKVRDKMRQRIG